MSRDDNKRYFNNPYCAWVINEKYQRKKLEPGRLSSEYVPMIDTYIEQIKESAASTTPDGGIYVGYAGIAFMYYRLSKSRFMKDKREEHIKLANTYIRYAKEYVQSKKRQNKQQASESGSADDVGLLCGNGGILIVSAAISYLNQEKFESEINNYYKGFNVAKTEFSTSGCDELLVGRAGYLSGLYWLSKEFPGQEILKNDERILAICKIMYNSGRNYAKEHKLKIPLMYAYHGTEYLGAAHGISGILLMMLNSPWFIDYPHGIADDDWELREICQNIHITIDSILDLQDADGNFATRFQYTESERVGKKNELVHWCHGAPGIIYLFAKAYRVFNGDIKYLNACKRAAECIWQKGLLLKGPGICHGIAGNGYAFVLMYRLTKENKYLYYAQCFAKFLTNDEFLKRSRIPDRKCSLYEGIAGTVCFLLDLLEPDNENHTFPLF